MIYLHEAIKNTNMTLSELCSEIHLYYIFSWWKLQYYFNTDMNFYIIIYQTYHNDNQIWLNFWQKYIQIFPFFVSKEWLDHMKITIVFQGIVVILLTIIIKDVGVLVNSKSHFKTNLDIREKTIKCSAMHPNFPSFKYREDLCCYKEKFRGKSKSIDLLK